MKNKIKLLKFMLFIGLLYSCEEKPLEAVYVEPPQYYLLDTIARSTRDPFVEIKDRGLEGFLVIFGYDKDNQVNGKVAKSDIDKIQRLSLDTFYYTWSLDQNGTRHEYFTEKYNLAVLDDKNLLDGQRKRLVIKSIDDLKHFDNLEILEISSLVIDSLTINFKNKIYYLTAPKKATFVSLDSCKSLRNLTMGEVGVDLNLSVKYSINLDQLYVTGNFNDLNLSNNLYVKSLILKSNQRQKVNLSQFKGLEGVGIFNANKLKELYLPKNIASLHISETAIDALDFSQLSNLRSFYVQKNNFLSSINLNSATKLTSCSSMNNPLLSEIQLNANVKIDTLATVEGLIPIVKLWQKDPWTKWILKN